MWNNCVHIRYFFLFLIHLHRTINFWWQLFTPLWYNTADITKTSTEEMQLFVSNASGFGGVSLCNTFPFKSSYCVFYYIFHWPSQKGHPVLWQNFWIHIYHNNLCNDIASDSVQRSPKKHRGVTHHRHTSAQLSISIGL